MLFNVEIYKNWPDTIPAWAELYFRFEVTTSERSQKEQQRDFRLFHAFLLREAGSDERTQWTPRVSRAFVDALRSEVKEEGGRRWSDRTVNRIVAHLKTFAKWIHKLRPFPLGNPTEKLKSLSVTGVLELERALTEAERRKLLDAADHLPVINTVWNEVCRLAHVQHRTPHSARHAMGVHLVKKTGNPRTAQRQLGHKNPSTTMQYMQFTREEMQEALDER